MFLSIWAQRSFKKPELSQSLYAPAVFRFGVTLLGRSCPSQSSSSKRFESSEGVFVVYRLYDRISKDVLSFSSCIGAGDDFEVLMEVSNTGAVAGGAVVQVYAGRTGRSANTVVRVLVAFDKVRLQPGENTVVKLTVSVKDFASFDEAVREWVVEAGDYSLYLVAYEAETL
ncbi:thermostable beta-glucosidase B [Colletotrichum orchidophilum]|uniref:beta-glucosidase n=1 Tax=Colletotrichum orchidophilum TaxID=1209926 RepID=A0A1G4BMI8_9PEZI|nr:thermostable beta-glucosidase B [Colletotrichum orchidophilum]OHF02518.1 thermostable beta-glucosidase B [Colletotrichum orchidophilum]